MSFNPMTSSFGPVIADDARGPVTSSPTYRYVYADYVDEPMLRHTGTTTTLPTTGHSALYYHRNQQYSIVGLTNAAGTLVERYTYSAYGTLGIYAANGTVRTSSTYANRYTYTGREWDADLRLYHFRARWYDPATGGFVTRDPLGYVDGMSLYRGYFGVKGVDADGLFSRVLEEEPHPELFWMERHHWFPQAFRVEIETLCWQVFFNIDAYVTSLLAAQLPKMRNRIFRSRDYDDHNYIEHWRHPNWQFMVEELLVTPGMDCCRFLNNMIDKIRIAYLDVQLREINRGARVHYKDPIEFAVFPYEGGKGFPGGWDYESVKTWPLLLKQRDKACEKNRRRKTDFWGCNKWVRDRVLPLEDKEPIGPTETGVILEDPIVMEIAIMGGAIRSMIVRALWAPTVRPVFGTPGGWQNPGIRPNPFPGEIGPTLAPKSVPFPIPGRLPPVIAP